MHYADVKLQYSAKVTVGGKDIDELHKEIVDKAHDAIVFTDNMTEDEKFLQMQSALYQILDLLGD